MDATQRHNTLRQSSPPPTTTTTTTAPLSPTPPPPPKGPTPKEVGETRAATPRWKTEKEMNKLFFTNERPRGRQTPISGRYKTPANSFEKNFVPVKSKLKSSKETTKYKNGWPVKKRVAVPRTVYTLNESVQPDKYKPMNDLIAQVRAEKAMKKEKAKREAEKENLGEQKAKEMEERNSVGPSLSDTVDFTEDLDDDDLF